MSYSILYFDEVRLDIAEAKQWYAEQQKGLEKRFAKSIKNSLAKIKKLPHANAVRYKNIRIAHPSIFPYSINYYIDEMKQQIVIVAIAHNHRDENFVTKRVR